MKIVNINGAQLTPLALAEIRFMQTGIDDENHQDLAEPNAGLNYRLEIIDKITRFLILLEIDERADKVLCLLKELSYLRDSFYVFRLPDDQTKP